VDRRAFIGTLAGSLLTGRSPLRRSRRGRHIALASWLSRTGASTTLSSQSYASSGQDRERAPHRGLPRHVDAAGGPVHHRHGLVQVLP
jgi:hypothetical protein